MKTPHKHAELIKAWADGAEIEMAEYGQMSGELLGWKLQHPPYWHESSIYRIKLEPKPDVVKYANIYVGGVGSFHDTLASANCGADPYPAGVLKITINGETGKASAEVV